MCRHAVWSSAGLPMTGCLGFHHHHHHRHHRRQHHHHHTVHDLLTKDDCDEDDDHLANAFTSPHLEDVQHFTKVQCSVNISHLLSWLASPSSLPSLSQTVHRHLKKCTTFSSSYLYLHLYLCCHRHHLKGVPQKVEARKLYGKLIGGNWHIKSCQQHFDDDDDIDDDDDDYDDNDDDDAYFCGQKRKIMGSRMFFPPTWDPASMPSFPSIFLMIMIINSSPWSFWSFWSSIHSSLLQNYNQQAWQQGGKCQNINISNLLSCLIHPLGKIEGKQKCFRNNFALISSDIIISLMCLKSSSPWWSPSWTSQSSSLAVQPLSSRLSHARSHLT